MFREPLLQSPLWRSFQEKSGRACVEGSFGLGVIETLPLVGPYLYCPRGPIPEELRIKDELLKAAEGAEAGWIRVEPGSEAELEMLRALFGEGRVVVAPHDVQPREILVMDIRSDDAAFLSAMKPKTRYNIRLSEKHGVTVRFSRSEADMERFIELIYATTGRKAIRPHPREYYRNFFRAFDEAQCVLALAEHDGQVLAVNLLVFFDGVAYYLHGGSSDEGRHLMAPYLLQWESIREAKRRGCTLYDFGGVRTEVTSGKRGAPSSDWSGITRFKQGFAPTTQPIVFPGAYDIVVSFWRYRLYQLLRSFQQLRKKIL